MIPPDSIPSSTPNSIANIGDLAKPFTTLIEKVADATGAYFRPNQIVREAKAEAEALKIKAFAEMEIAEATEIQRRTFAWALGEQTKFQENRERILIGTIPELKEDAKPEEIDNDWLANFFDKCKLISNEQMQSVWSSLLAGEANKPGSFSKRTVGLVSTLNKSDAELFTNLCGFVWYIEGIHILIYNFRDSIYNHKNINFETLSHLEAIGLIQFAAFGTFAIDSLSKTNSFSYFDTSLNVDLQNKSENTIEIGSVLLTKSGEELASICKSEKVDGFLEYVLQKWQESGYIACSPLTLGN